MTRYLACLLLAAPLYCRQHNTDKPCPWLNVATAAGVLGGPVRAKVTTTACDFVRQQSQIQYRLRIVVRTMPNVREGFAYYLSRCGPHAVPLKTVGNEAYMCPQDRRVLGRVRDQVFNIRVTTTDRGARQTTLEDDAFKVAEQVAGNLF